MKKLTFTAYDFTKPAVVRIWELDEFTRLEALYGKVISDLFISRFKEVGDSIIKEYQNLKVLK